MKKILIYLIAISYLLALTSCGQNIDKENPLTEVTTQATPDPTSSESRLSDPVSSESTSSEPVSTVPVSSESALSESSKDTIIVFEDPIIKQMALNALNRSTEDKTDITVSEALQITSMSNTTVIFHGDPAKVTPLAEEVLIADPDTGNHTITTLHNLKWFENLESLYIRDCGLTSLEGIESLKELVLLNVRGNHVIDLSPIADLEKLDAVCMVGNPASNDSLNQVMKNKKNRYSYTEETMIVHPDLPEIKLQSIMFENKNGEIENYYLRIINSQTRELINDFITYGIRRMFGTLEKLDHNALDTIDYIDMNFDGYREFRIYDAMNGNYIRNYLYFFWDTDKNCFIRNDSFFPFGSIGFSEEEQLVYCMTRSGAANHWQDTYQYINNKLIQIEALSDTSVYFKTDVTDEQIADIVPIINDNPSWCFQYIEISKINYNTMQLEITEQKFELYIPNDWILLGEYPIDSEIGAKLKELKH